MNEPEKKLPRKRRTDQERKEALAEKIKQIDQALLAKVKTRLEALKASAEELALASSGKPYAGQIGQAATLLGQAAATIKVAQ